MLPSASDLLFGFGPEENFEGNISRVVEKGKPKDIYKNPDSPLNKEKIQFYKIKGTHSWIVPLHAIRIFENSIFSLSFFRNCDQESKAQFYAMESSGKTDGTILGPKLASADCQIDINFNYSEKKPLVEREIQILDTNPVIDMEMVKIGMKEFMDIMASNSFGLKMQYNQNTDMKERLDSLCMNLLGGTCSTTAFYF